MKLLYIPENPELLTYSSLNTGRNVVIKSDKLFKDTLFLDSIDNLPEECKKLKE